MPNQSFSDKEHYEAFVNSAVFKKTNLLNWFKDQTVEIKSYKVLYEKNELEKQVPKLNVFLYNKDNSLVGIIEAISFLNHDGVLDYHALLRNFERFNINQKKGWITLTDLNEEFSFVSAKLDGYSVLEIINYTDQQIGLRNNPADLNGNSDVTFAECFKFMNNTCADDPDCFVSCYFIGDMIGWVTSGWGALCQYSIAGACVYISWNY